MNNDQLSQKGYVEISPGVWQKSKPPHVVATIITTGGLVDPAPLITEAVRKRLRQSSKPLLNKLETDFRDNFLPKDVSIRAQAIRFKLANGLWYKPDFVSIRTQEAWEVKGPHAFRGGFENLKMAATTYPELTWILAWKEDGAWKTQRVWP